MENNLTHGELALMIGSLTEKVTTANEVFKEKLDALVIQTTKTNGRTGVLEKKEDERTGEMRIIKWLSASLLIPIILLIVKAVWFS